MVCLTKYDHMIVDNGCCWTLAGIKPGLRTPAAFYYLSHVAFLSGLGLPFVARLSLPSN